VLSTKRRRALVLTTVSGALLGGLLTVPGVAALPATTVPAITATPTALSTLAERRQMLVIKRTALELQVEQRNEQAQAAARARAVARVAALRARAVELGLSREGMRYSAGSSGPRSFDCSGFTSWVWRTAGQPIARTSYDQYATLPRVSRSSAKPGDLVFFFGRGAHHVGLYIGRNQMIHSANYGTGVVITSLDEGWYASRLSGFRRVV